jgi:membrane-associated phospholipid phosphatase
MKLSLAKIISLIFHPVTAVTLAPFLLIYKTTHNFQAASYWTIHLLIFLIFFMIFVVIAVRKKIFSDMDVSKREQRPLLYHVGSSLAVVYFISLFLLKAPFILYFVTIGLIFGIVLFSIINRRIKASIHVATITALILPLAVSYGQYYLLLLFIIPLVVWSRLKTKRHSLSEIFVGGTVGGFLSMSFYYLAKIFLNK